MVNVSSKAEALKRVRQAQAAANEARAERERENIDDAASLVVEHDRLKSVDQWEDKRIGEIRAEADRRRREHRAAGAAALTRMQGRGETLAAIAELTGVTVRELGATLKAAPTNSRRGSQSGEVPGADGTQAQEAIEAIDRSTGNTASAPPATGPTAHLSG
jgi:hypothetical protein